MASSQLAPSAELVLVTGISGFQGGWCAVALLRAGCHVRGSLRRMDRCEPLRQAIAAEGVAAGNDQLSFCCADLTKDEGWSEAERLHLSASRRVGHGSGHQHPRAVVTRLP